MNAGATTLRSGCAVGSAGKFVAVSNIVAAGTGDTIAAGSAVRVDGRNGEADGGKLRKGCEVRVSVPAGGNDSCLVSAQGTVEAQEVREGLASYRLARCFLAG